MSRPSIENRLAAILLTLLLAACATVPQTPPDPTAPAALAPPLQDRYRQGLAALAAGDAAAALAPLQAVVTARPDLAVPRFNLGLALARLGDDQAALAALRAAVRLDPGLAAAHNQMGILLRRAGDFEGARRAYQQALAADPGHARAHLNLGILYDLYLDRPALALRHYQRYQELSGGEDREVTLWIVDLRRRLAQLAHSTPENTLGGAVGETVGGRGE